MSLSPFSAAFVPRSSCNHNTSKMFVHVAKRLLSHFCFKMLCDIISEWESSPLLSMCFSKWEKYEVPQTVTVKGLHILCFNVRGFSIRWQEVLLLSSSHDFDLLILLETGQIDTDFCLKVFHNFNVYYNKGENKNGGVLMFSKPELNPIRNNCTLANVVVVDVMTQDPVRIIGVYAPSSRSWSWDNLSPYVTTNCVICGDFNMDLEADKNKADELLKWADSQALAPFLPTSSTSRRSKRIIDYAWSNGPKINVQTLTGKTTSDHNPLSITIHTSDVVVHKGFATHWKVFTSFTEYTSEFWRNQWKNPCYDNVYETYIRFLRLLEARCTTYFPMNKYRVAIPPDLRAFMSFVRALSFKSCRLNCSLLRAKVVELRKCAKSALKDYLSWQFDRAIKSKNSGNISASLWSKTKRHMKPRIAHLWGLIAPDGAIVKDPEAMGKMAAEHYTSVFAQPEVVRPHPYTDSPMLPTSETEGSIPTVSLTELVEVVRKNKQKRSKDAHGISAHSVKFLHESHWDLMLGIYNRSFRDAVLPTAWKDSRILLLAKKNHICEVNQTRAISLLDTFQKIGEKLFLTRFREALRGKGILPNNQSGFRPKHRLQSRVLLFIDELSSILANSAPVTTIFVDFKTAFDMLWHEGCVGKLMRMGIPTAFTNWIKNWLVNRRGFIEIQGQRSDWFKISRGGPQGGVLTPTLFITYHADMPSYISCCSSHFFADDLAAIIGGHLGAKYSLQCIEVEKRVNVFLGQLEWYCLLAGQPVNYNKTEALWSARAIGSPKFHINHNNNSVNWSTSFKYLGYWITPKLGWSVMLHETSIKIRQRVASLNSFKLFGSSSVKLRRLLFEAYVFPLFAWLFPIYPLCTRAQRSALDRLYFTAIKKVYRSAGWRNELISFLFDEVPLHSRCVKYWRKMTGHLENSSDGNLLLEQTTLNQWRTMWLGKEFPISRIRRSKRFVAHKSVLDQIFNWMQEYNLLHDSPVYKPEEIEALIFFPDSFL